MIYQNNVQIFEEIQKDGSIMIVTAYWIESKGWEILKRVKK